MEEGEGESSSPAKAFDGHDIWHDIYARLLDSGNEEACSNPELLDQLENHFSRLPTSYAVDVNIESVEDVLLHIKILADAKDPENRPIFFVRFMKYIQTKMDGYDDLQQTIRVSASSKECDDNEDGDLPLNLRDHGIDFEPCSKLEDLNLNVRKNVEDIEERQDVKHVPVHEIIFSSLDKPKLLSQLSALLSDVGLNIREAHVFSTTDGYSLDIFVVDGWPLEEADGLLKELKKAVTGNEGSWSGSSHSTTTDKILVVQPNCCDGEIDKRLLKMGDRIASGSCGDLYRGTYLGQDVAVKVLRSEHLNEDQGVEFAQEVMILRKVHHKNVVRFIGACTKPPQFCIVTEYMTGGNLYDFLHKRHNVLELSPLLKFAIDISRGMGYLHQNNIIHRDLKTANLLMDTNNKEAMVPWVIQKFQRL